MILPLLAHPKFLALKFWNCSDGGFYAQRLQYSKATKLFEQAFEIGRQTTVKNSKSPPVGANKLANVYYLGGKYTAAQKLYREIITPYLDPHTKFTRLIEYGNCLQDAHNKEKSIEIFKQPLDTAKESNDQAAIKEAEKHLIDVPKS